jgi:hypothetical protein
MISTISTAKKTVQAQALIASVAATIEEDCWLIIAALATAHGTSVTTIHEMLLEDLGLEKMFTRWVFKLFNDNQKQQHVEVCSEFVANPLPLSRHTGLNQKKDNG